jgi:hypothetical protein
MKYGKEEIKTFKTNEGEEIIYKGNNAKIEPTVLEEKSLVGTEVTVTVGDNIYKTIIKE